MIEKKEAVDNLDEILSVPGIDMVVWGGSDYSMSIGKPGAARDPDVLATRDYVHKRALEMGIQPRAEISDPEDAKPFLDQGIRHFALGTDIAILFNWWKENVQKLSDIMAGA